MISKNNITRVDLSTNNTGDVVIVGISSKKVQLTATSFISGPRGLQGDKGDPGQGIPVGGNTDQILAKIGPGDYNVEWRDNLDAADFATAAQGILADTAIQPSDLSPVAISGLYNDLTGKPTGATSSVEGLIRLSGDLGGSYIAPKVKRTTRFIVAPYGDTRPADYTCANATDNDVEIQQAIDAAGLVTGIVDLLDGDFYLSHALLPVSGVWLRGQGKFATRLHVTAGQVSAILDFQFQGSFTRDNPLSKFEMTDLECDSSAVDDSNIATKAIAGHYFTDCNFSRLYIHDSPASGLGIDFPVRSHITHNLIVNCGYSFKRIITAASWSAGVFTYTTSANHGYVVGVKATGTLTATGTINDGDSVLIDDIVYTFKTTITGNAYEIAIGANADAALTNLGKALAVSGVAGTDYGIGTEAHPTVRGGTEASQQLPIIAVSFGTSSNSISTNAIGSNISFATTTLSGGVNGSSIVITGMTPANYNGVFTVTSVPTTTTFTVDATTNTLAVPTKFSVSPGTATILGYSSKSLPGHNGVGIGSNGSYDESLICTNNVVIGCQNNNYLIENQSDVGGTLYNTNNYIFANNVSLNAGQTGFRNSGSINTIISNNFDYGSLRAVYASITTIKNVITSATWSTGVATIQTINAHGMSVGSSFTITGMLPSTWNGYYTVVSVIDSTTITVAITSNPGSVVYYGGLRFVDRPVSRTTIENNIFSYNVDRAINLAPRSDDITIQNNIINNCVSGYGIDGSTSSCTIVGNKIHDNALTGINITISSTDRTPSENINIQNNQIYNNGKRSTGYDGIFLTASTAATMNGVLISDNNIYDTQPVKTQRYGIKFGSSITNMVITDNNLASNLTSGISGTSQDTITIFNNNGVNPQAKVNVGSALTGSVTFDCTVGNYFTGVLAGDITAVMPNGTIDGQQITLSLQQDSTGSRRLTLPANTYVANTGSISLSTSANAIDVIVFSWRSTNSKWVEVSRSLRDIQTTPLRVKTVASVSAVYTPNVDTTDLALIASPGANFTIANPTGTPVDGQRLQIRVTSSATGRVPTWGAIYAAQVGQTLPSTVLPNSSVITFTFQYNAATSLFVLQSSDYQTSVLPVSLGGTGAVSSATSLMDLYRKQPIIYSDFITAASGSQLDPFLGVAFSSGVIGSQNISGSSHHPGSVRVTSSTTANSGGLVGTNSSQLLLGGGEVFEAVFQLGTLTSSIYWLGFIDTSTAAEPTDGVYIGITAAGVVTGKTSNNATRSSTGTTYTAVTGTWYRIKIVVSATNLVTFTLYNDAGTVQWTDTLTTNIPSTAGRETGAGVLAYNSGTTAVTMIHVDYMAVAWTTDRTR